MPLRFDECDEHEMLSKLIVGRTHSKGKPKINSKYTDGKQEEEENPH